MLICLSLAPPTAAKGHQDTILGSLLLVQVAQAMLQGAAAGSWSCAPSFGSQSTSPSAASSPMPPPSRPHAAGNPAGPHAEPPGSGNAGPTEAAGSEEARAKAATDLLMLHACLSKLMGPQSGEPCSGHCQDDARRLCNLSNRSGDLACQVHRAHHEVEHSPIADVEC